MSGRTATAQLSPASNLPSTVRVVTDEGTPAQYTRKENKKCEAPSLRKDAKTAQEMVQFAFTPGLTLNFDQAPAASVVSSSSSTSSAEVDRGADHKQKHLNQKILKQTESRQGRESQRWSTKDNHRVRLVTGCVPILKGGNILFVSSRNKPEWILPKGGWEEDEAMEESALRETFEEAGVMGTLGAKLTPFEYETRKSKKRRKEMEELLKKNKEEAGVTADESKEPVTKKVKESVSPEEDKAKLMQFSAPSTDSSPEPRVQNSLEPKSSSGAILSEAVVERIPGPELKKRSDETASNASDSSSNYSFVKLTMFPLYVSEIREAWPENGRLRKVVHIDEAIKLMEKREEFRAALVEVKEKKLHLVSETPIVEADHP